ncbi:MAG: hypothetical protein ISS49_08640 [Anaerolineae bacterium]|nr:hypothetical protein [Anaerolineae bacterium]
MPIGGKRWTVQDRYGNSIYLTQKQWEHIIAPTNHPEMVDYEGHLKETLRLGRRRQEPLNPRKYRYVRYFDDLPDGSNHTVAIVLFRFDMDGNGRIVENNFVATAFFKHIRLKGSKG